MRAWLGPILVVGVFACGLSGCAGVKPWQREDLAARRMQLNADPLSTKLQEHVHQYREGSAGGFGASGGGCGCN